MKILYVSHGHFWGSTWPYQYIDGHIAETLTKMGHTVRTFDIFTRADIYHRTLLEHKLKNNIPDPLYIQMLEDRASADLPFEALEFEPDLILHIVGRIGLRVLNVLKKIKMKTAVWFLDDPQEIDFTTKRALFYTYAFTTEEAAVPAYKEAGHPHIEHLPLGYAPEVHSPVSIVPEEYKSDICFIGVPFPIRAALFDDLADFMKNYTVKIVGGGPNVGSREDPWEWGRRLKRMDVYEPSIRAEMVEPTETAKYFNGAKINLNIHREPWDDRFLRGNSKKILPISVNNRTFEIAGCGAFQLIDESRSGISKVFEPGKEIVTYKDPDDLQKKIAYYMQHPGKRLDVARAAALRAQSEHTYEKRLTRILEVAS